MPRTRFTTGTTTLTTSTDVANLILEHLNIPPRHHTHGSMNITALRKAAPQVLETLSHDPSPVAGGIIRTRLHDIYRLATHTDSRTLTWAPVLITAHTPT